MSKTPEGAVKSDIRKWLDKRGLWRAGAPRPKVVNGWYYMPVPHGFGVHGIPDFCGIWRGRPFFIEAKAPGGVQTPNQIKRQEEIVAAGGWYLLVENVSQLDEFEEKLNEKESDSS